MTSKNPMNFRKSALTALTLPLALALAACGSGSVDDALPESGPIAAIPAPEGQIWADIASETPEGGFVIGNPEAPLKLVEYASYTCSHCADFSEEASATLRDKYVASGVVSYELRNMIRDPVDLTAAILARCAGPGAFHPLSDQVWANQAAMFETISARTSAYTEAVQAEDGTRYQKLADVAGFLDFFAARGISRDQAMACLADTAKADEIIERSTTQSDELQLTGTPSFILNGRKLNSARWSELETILQNAGAR